MLPGNAACRIFRRMATASHSTGTAARRRLTTETRHVSRVGRGNVASRGRHGSECPHPCSLPAEPLRGFAAGRGAQDEAPVQYQPAASCGKSPGMTMIEIMLVVAIVGLLSIIAIPSFQTARRRAQNTAFLNDLRTLVDSVLNQYAMAKGDYPADAAPGVLPTGVAEFMPRHYDWTAKTPIGGNWDWDRAAQRGQKVYGICYAGLSVQTPDRTSEQMADIDKQIDDGDLSTGAFRSRDNGYIYTVEP